MSTTTKSTDLANRLKEVLLSGKWIAHTNIQAQLQRTSWKLANKKIGSHNSIAELTFHIDYYVGGILNVLKGGDLEIRDKYSFSMSKIESESDWQNLIQSFVKNAQDIVVRIKAIPDSRWSEPFVRAEYGTYERNIEGLIEHSYYHFGQISLLLKLLEEESDFV